MIVQLVSRLFLFGLLCTSSLGFGKDRLCRSYFASVDMLMHAFSTHVGVPSTLGNRKEKELTEQEQMTFITAKNIKDLHSRILNYLVENQNIKFGPRTLDQLSALALAMIENELYINKIEYIRDRINTNEYIIVLPEGSHPLNKMSADLFNRYGRQLIFDTRYIYESFSYAAESSEFFILPIDASYNFSVRSSYIPHEIIHIKTSNLSVPSSLKYYLIPQEGIARGQLKTRLDGYREGYRIDELIAYERESLFLIQQVLSAIKTNKKHTRYLEKLKIAVAIWLDLSEYTYAALSGLQKKGITENSFIQKTESLDEAEHFGSIETQVRIGDRVDTVRLATDSFFEENKVQSLEIHARLLSKAHFFSYRAFVLSKLAATYLEAIKTKKKEDVYIQIKDLQRELRNVLFLEKPSRTFDIIVQDSKANPRSY